MTNLTWNEFNQWRKANKFTKQLLFLDNWYNFKSATKFPFTVDYENLWYLA